MGGREIEQKRKKRLKKLTDLGNSVVIVGRARGWREDEEGWGGMVLDQDLTGAVENTVQMACRGIVHLTPLQFCYPMSSQ